MTRRFSYRPLVTALAALGVCGAVGIAQEPVINREYEIKAAYLYNFGRYIEWPSDAPELPQESFVIGVLGKDPFQGDLDKIAESKTINGKKIVIRRFKSLDEYRPCHVLFVAAAGSTDAEKDRPDARLIAALAKIKDSPVLVAAETGGAGEKGAAFNFYVEDNRVKFEVNVEAFKKAGLKVSSRLLQLAKVVKDSREKN